MVAVQGLVGLAILWVIVYIASLTFLPSVASSLIVTTVLVLGVAALLASFTNFKTFPFKLNKMLTIVIGAVLVVSALASAGVIGKIGPFGKTTASVTSPITTVTSASAASCRDSVSPEILGKAATLDVNAFDLESDTPYSAAIDLTTNCWIFKNGNQNENFVSTTSDTSAATLSGFAVGDTAYVYCGGTTYYTEPVEGLCVQSERQPLVIKSHTIEGVASLDITGYDSTGSATLGAGFSNGPDYNISAGPSEVNAFELKLKVNSANNAWQHCGWAIADFNITHAKPIGGDYGASYKADPTRIFLKDLTVGISNSPTADSVTTTKSYIPYVLGSPVMLSEFDELQDRFEIKSGSGDPLGTNQNTTRFNGVALSTIDCAFNRGDDGNMYLTYYAKTSAEGNVGATEDLTSPIGGDDTVLIGLT